MKSRCYHSETKKEKFHYIIKSILLSSSAIALGLVTNLSLSVMLTSYSLGNSKLAI
ncbi:exported hypothetical protein [Xenorhabdus bovienii str. oregonense]|uniref:Uncharacterized protein n=2 Tax=Xenorhabdus bovienii TaxID=40576 RepID=A0A077P921_XENBV|nr:exported hypothetical protein [Xenorhabdus bovienii str. feltiae Moldova]CDH07329.1 exported hypothetical protein [Xenorhabdus bovienii str. oregonense]